MAPIERGPDAGGAAVVPELAPQEKRTARPQARRSAPTRRLEPGDAICGRCGEGNDAARRFCSRCGESLALAEYVATPWWLRWRQRLTRGPRVRAGGHTPGDGAVPDPRSRRSARGVVRGVVRTVQTYVAIVVLGAGLLVGLYPPLRTAALGWVDGVRQQVTAVAEQTLSPARPVSVTGVGAQDPEHPAALAFDTFSNTYWAAPFTPTAPPTITIDLGKITALARVIVRSGASDGFATRHRPSIINLAYSNEKSDTFTLKDTSDPQEIPLQNGLGAQTVRIKVLDVYSSEQSNEVAVAEFEFFALGR